MDNLHISVLSPSYTSSKLPERMEQKFFFPPNRIPLAHALLLRTCRAEAHAPFDQVNSVYFDTMDLDQHQRSLDGELVKDKVRIRWYGDEHDPHLRTPDREAPSPDAERTVDVWLELKSRRGFVTTKQRLKQSVPEARLALPALRDGIISPAVLRKTMASFGFFPPRPILPVIVISYWRHRLVEPITGTRLTIDSHIRSTLLVRAGVPGERRLELPGAVVEVKHSDVYMPPSLRQLAALGSSWSRFSKYSACLEAHEADRGSVSRLWPWGLSDPDPGPIAWPGPRGSGRVNRPTHKGDQIGRRREVDRRAIAARSSEDRSTE